MLARLPIWFMSTDHRFGVGAFDLPTLASVGAVLLAISAAAAYLPARSVDRLDPVRVVNGD